jgi:hypothetical protein
MKTAYEYTKEWRAKNPGRLAEHRAREALLGLNRFKNSDSDADMIAVARALVERA